MSLRVPTTFSKPSLQCHNTRTFLLKNYVYKIILKIERRQVLQVLLLLALVLLQQVVVVHLAVQRRVDLVNLAQHLLVNNNQLQQAPLVNLKHPLALVRAIQERDYLVNQQHLQALQHLVQRRHPLDLVQQAAQALAVVLEDLVLRLLLNPYLVCSCKEMLYTCIH